MNVLLKTVEPLKDQYLGMKNRFCGVHTTMHYNNFIMLFCDFSNLESSDFDTLVHVWSAVTF